MHRKRILMGWAFRWRLAMCVFGYLKSGVVAALVILAAVMWQAQPVQAQGYPSVDCNNPYYYEYCQQYYSWYDQYYAPYSYAYSYPYYYGYGVPVAVGLGFGFFHNHHRFHHDGFHHGFHGGGFHGGGGHGGHR